MPDYGKISWQSTESAEGFEGSCAQIEPFLELCKKQIPQKSLLKSCATLIEERNSLRDAHTKTIKKISQLPFLAGFLMWVKEQASSNSDMLAAAMLLLEEGFIGITDKKGKVWTITDAKGFDHSVVINAIRCRREIPLQKREQLVTGYLSFMQWLSEETFGYTHPLEDPDWVKIKGRLLSLPQFITFLSALKDKEQVVAKLLYYGGSRTLEEVLNVQLEDIDFKKQLIRYQSQLIHYPSHVFADIQALAGKSTRGKLFLGRQNASLNPSTIFRNFKEVAIEIGLGESFSPAALTTGL